MRKRKQAEHVNHERWLVSYADFITLLFAFFTTLYAISTVDQDKAGKLQYSMRTAFNVDFFKSDSGVSGYSPMGNPAVVAVQILYRVTRRIPAISDQGSAGAPPNDQEAAADRYQAATEALEQLAADPVLAAKMQVRVEKRGTVVSLSEAGFFGSGEAAMAAGSLSAVNQVADILVKAQPLDITVEGHTDDVPVRSGRYSSNWELSTARATYLVAYFIEKHAFSPAHLSAAGYAEYRPIASNADAVGRARNRRVDLVLLRPDGKDATIPALTTPTTASTEPAAAAAAPAPAPQETTHE